MRFFALVRAVALCWMVLSGAAVADEPPPAGHTIGVFGDSLGDGLWGGLYAVLKSHPEDHLYRYSKVGAGIARSDYDNWFEDFTAALDRDHIDVAVVMFGANDQQSIRDESHKGYNFPTDGWKTVYSARVDSILGEFSKRKIPVIWVGLPIMRKDELNTGAEVLDDIFVTETNRSGATFVPMFDAFKGDDGQFATHLPDASGHLRQVRADDGIHFTPYGYELIATKVTQAIGMIEPPGKARTATRQ